MRYQIVRIAQPSDYEADLIKLLSPEERTSALLAAAEDKLRQNSNKAYIGQLIQQQNEQTDTKKRG